MSPIQFLAEKYKLDMVQVYDIVHGGIDHEFDKRYEQEDFDSSNQSIC